MIEQRIITGAEVRAVGTGSAMRVSGLAARYNSPTKINSKVGRFVERIMRGAFSRAINVQQLREAFPFGSAPRFVIFDRDAKYGLEVPAAVRSLSVSPVRTSFESPWQNGVAERWVGSCRRDLLDHIIAVDERHLKRRLSEFRYYHEDHTHLWLGRERQTAELAP